MDGILSPPIRVSGLDAQHPDAELVESPLGVGNHLLGVGRHADRPFERDARLRKPADQVIDGLINRLADRIVERSVQRGASHVVRGCQIIEQSMNGLDIEDSLPNQARSPDLPDHRDHGRIGVRHRVVWRERPDLTSTDDAFGKDRDQDRLAEQRAGRAGIVRSRRSLALQAGLQIGDANLDAFDAHVSRVRSRAFRVFAAWRRPRRRRGSTAPGRDERAAQPGSRPRRRYHAIENRS